MNQFLVLSILLFSSSPMYSKHLNETDTTMSKKAFVVPEWAKHVVWYQIFPERFRNGDQSNDPKLLDQTSAYPHDSKSTWKIHPWTSDWYKLQPYEQKNGNSIWWNIQRRRYGGDLQGIIDKLDYIKELGIGAIYLNPIFDSPSSHKYDGATYHHVDPTFGPDPIGDRKLISTETPDDPNTWVWTSADKLALKLIDECHKRNIRIIFDGVFNHMGVNSWAFRDVIANQNNSKFKNWFSIKTFEDKSSETKFDYTGWFGVRDLPEIRENENGMLDEGAAKYIFESTKRWMSPNNEVKSGIDGWRLDVAFCVGHPFWKAWRKHVKSINPDAYITAEIIDTVDYSKPFLEGDEFDAVMNYNFAFACSEFFIADKTRITVSEFDEKLKYLREAYPNEVAYVMQNLFGSHDTDRLGSHIVNRDKLHYRNFGEFFGKSKAENSNYDSRKPKPQEIQIQKLFAIFQMTYIGAPMIYYGDEVGMWGANDPCCRKPMIWDDFNYDDETVKPNGKKRKHPDKVEINHDLLSHYKKLISIRNQYEALRIGEHHNLLLDNENSIYSFSRKINNQSVIVVLNNSKHLASVKLNLSENWKDVLNGDEVISTESIKVAAKWGRILVQE